MTVEKINPIVRNDFSNLGRHTVCFEPLKRDTRLFRGKCLEYLQLGGLHRPGLNRSV